MAIDDSTVEYRDIPGFPGYRVGSDGSVWTCLKRGYRIGRESVITDEWRPRKASKNQRGYCGLSLRRDGRDVNCLVHRLVLESFVGPCPDGMEGAHGNGIRTDSRLSNLRWATPSGNWSDRFEHGTDTSGERSWIHKLTDATAIQALHDWAAGEMQISIAKRLGVTVQAINYLVRGKTWKHIPRPSGFENLKPK